MYKNQKKYLQKKKGKKIKLKKQTQKKKTQKNQQLTKSKFNYYSANSNSFNDDKKVNNQHINTNKRINHNLLYFREPKVIRNNEKLMMDLFKKKDKCHGYIKP